MYRGWRSYLGGRYSPFATASPSQAPPRVSDSDYSYVGPEDIVDPPSQHPSATSDGYFSTFTGRATKADAENPNVPDILVLKHKGRTIPLHFRAFSIGEGQLSVGALRQRAAKELKAPTSRIKLLYKARPLKDDAAACREEGLKQNSELMVVVSEGGANGEDESSESASEEEMRQAGEGGPRVDVDGTIIGGGPKRKRKNHRAGKKTRKDGRGDGYDSNRDSDRRGSPPIPQGYTNQHHPSVSVPQPSQNPPAPTWDSAPPKPPVIPANAPPMQKLDMLSSHFRNMFVPLCEGYIARPPSDQKSRDFEYKRLSESILAQVVLKLDEVETDGDHDARSRRKELVQMAQAMLKRLDEAHGRFK